MPGARPPRCRALASPISKDPTTERPELAPNLHRLLAEHERFRQSTHGRLLAPGELYALGVFDASASPYLGAIAYRQDLFEARGLGADTWEELLASLGALQSEFTGSTPFAATRRALLFRAPSWFRSGVDERVAAYYHPERLEWRLGPLEREFEDYLRWFHRLVAEGLIAADSLDPRTALPAIWTCCACWPLPPSSDMKVK